MLVLYFSIVSFHMETASFLSILMCVIINKQTFVLGKYIVVLCIALRYFFFKLNQGGENIFVSIFYVCYERIMLVLLFLIKIMWCIWDKLAGGIFFLPRKWRKYSSWQLSFLLVIWYILENYAGVSISHPNHVISLR